MNCDEEHKLMMTTSVTPENAKCSACTRTFSETGETSLYYTCTDCDLMFHKKCAELPKQIDHPMHPQHPLILLAKPPYESKTCECQVCQEPWKTFGYHCSSCEFGIDILCVMLEDEAVTIPSHHHPVRLIRRPASFKCNACGLKGKGILSESYKCTKPSCGFWIHKECGLSPEMFKRPDHDHPLLLATSMPVRVRKYKFTCEHCHEDFRPHFWVYYCRRCKYFIHINCIALKARAPTASFYNYTYPLASKSQPPRLAIRQLKTISNHLNSDMLQEEGPQLAEVKVDSHDHSLVLNSNGLQDEDEMTCDGCIEPIDRATCPYYECGQHCNFLLHTSCTTLPRRLRVGDHIKLERRGFLKRRHDRVLVYGDLHFPKNPWEVVKCFACHSLCNGYTYMVHWLGTDYRLDIKCCYLKEFITHIGHRHDLKTNNQWYNELVQKSPQPLLEPLAVDFRWRPTPSYTCSGCGETHKAPHFYCEPCDFSLGYECATLPATVKHRWDKHPLVLSFPPHIRDTDEGEEFYCEVCEEEIYPKHLMYRCVECDRSFHPRCIPTLGESRNIKFGKTVSVKSHLHPLTLVPQAKLTSRCNTCRKSLHWSRAFECAQCGFYLCSDCL